MIFTSTSRTRRRSKFSYRCFHILARCAAVLDLGRGSSKHACRVSTKNSLCGFVILGRFLLFFNATQFIFKLQLERASHMQLNRQERLSTHLNALLTVHLCKGVLYDLAMSIIV